MFVTDKKRSTSKGIISSTTQQTGLAACKKTAVAHK